MTASSITKKKLKVDDNTHLCFPTLDYTDALFNIIQSQRVYLEKHLPWVKNIEKAWQAQAFLKEAIFLNKGKQRLTTLIIHQGQFVGIVSLLKINHKDKRAEIGYWLRKEVQGKGLMTRACRRLIQYGFKGLHLNRIEIKIATNNPSSRGIPLRLDFQLEGRLRAFLWIAAEERFEDVEIYSFLRDDFCS